MKKLYFVLFLAAGVYFTYEQSATVPAPETPVAAAEAADRPVFGQRHSGRQVQGQGTVSRILSDDNRGSRHQRFILTVASGQTLLVAHNIDLAPRIPSLAIGDEVAFNGEYEWNDKGGVIHWTHHDPQRRHVSGWLEHEGRRYE